MDQLFLSIVNMSVTATWIALAVILLRPLLKKAPKWITVAMWGLVAARLIIPFAPESSVSLIPSAETIPQDIVYSTAPEIDSGIFVVNSVVNPVIADRFTPTELGASVNPIQIFLFFVENVWVLGAVAMLIYAAISYLVIYRKVREATPLFDNVSKETLMGYEAIALCEFINGKRLDEYNHNSEICFMVHSCLDAIKREANIIYK